MRTLATVALILGTLPAFGFRGNARLGAVMKNLARDVGTVTLPTKKPDPATVTDAQILDAIVRARTARHLLQMVEDRRGKIENGAWVVGELTPAGLQELPLAKGQEMLDLFVEYLTKARTALIQAESQLSAELAKADPESRDFGPLKATAAELNRIMTEAHKIFRDGR